MSSLEFTLLSFHYFRDIKDVEDVTILENMTEHFPIVMVLIKECKGNTTDQHCKVRNYLPCNACLVNNVL